MEDHYREIGMDHPEWGKVETVDESALAQAPPQPDPLEERLKALLAPMQKQLEKLSSENQTLRAELNETLANGRESNLQGADFAPNPNAARSVVIGTRPVMDHPEQYNQKKSIIDPGGLVINDASPLSGKNR